VADDLAAIGRFIKRRKKKNIFYIQKVGKIYRLAMNLIFKPPRKAQFHNAPGKVELTGFLAFLIGLAG